tara:strand:+ start:3033 stop:3635 length:603 start_codon:yes stop_codon:yes gene_type:complete
MNNEETYLQNLLTNRRIVRNYIQSDEEYLELSKVADYAIKIPTAGFARGIEIVHVSNKENIMELAKLSNEETFVEKGFDKWISKSLSIYILLVNEKAYHERYAQMDKDSSTNSSNWDTPYWYVDAGAAMMNCMLLIEEIGLKSGFLGSHNMKIDNIKSLISIPENYKILGFITAGVEEKTTNTKNNMTKKKLTHNEYFSK